MIEPTAVWRACVAGDDPALLDTLFADDVVLHSPAIGRPTWGKAETVRFFAAFTKAVGGNELQPIGQWRDEQSAVIEFHGAIDGCDVHGVNLLHWNADGRVVDVTMMIRPLRANQLLADRLGMADRG